MYMRQYGRFSLSNRSGSGYHVRGILAYRHNVAMISHVAPREKMSRVAKNSQKTGG
jgi:RecB family endonuclease NucS